MLLEQDDPRVQPGAYINDGKQLYRVLDYEAVGQRLKVENCSIKDSNGTYRWEWLSTRKVEFVMTLTMPAPTRKKVAV